MKLIKNWKKAWKLASVQLSVLASGAILAYGTMYEQLKETIPPGYLSVLTIAIFIVRIIDFKPKK
jgi:hypothetical protein